jgi:hypothetical protein
VVGEWPQPQAGLPVEHLRVVVIRQLSTAVRLFPVFDLSDGSAASEFILAAR